MGRRFVYQFRLVWKYVGEQRPRTYVSDSASTVLRMLRRIGTDEPWMGVTPTQLKRSWAWVARRRNVPFDAIADMRPRDVLLALRDSFPPLEYIRVESRQVGAWTEVLDPLATLVSSKQARVDQKRRDTLAETEAMSRAALDAWRWVPSDEEQARRLRHDIGKKD